MSSHTSTTIPIWILICMIPPWSIETSIYFISPLSKKTSSAEQLKFAKNAYEVIRTTTFYKDNPWMSADEEGVSVRPSACTGLRKLDRLAQHLCPRGYLQWGFLPPMGGIGRRDGITINCLLTSTPGLQYHRE